MRKSWNKAKKFFHRATAVILVVALLPISDVLNCFEFRVLAAELEDVSGGDEADIPGVNKEISAGDSADVSAIDGRDWADDAGAGNPDGEETWTLAADYTLTEDMEVSGLILTDGTLDLNGYKLTVAGDMFQTGGILKMTDEEDTLCIKGSFTCETDMDSTGYLTAGVMEVEGDFTVSSTGNARGFVATGTHKLILSGEEAQKIQFKKSSASHSRLCNLEIDNQSEEGVTFEGSVSMAAAGNSDTVIPYVTGNITDNAKNVTGFISLGKNADFTENYFGGSIYVGEDYSFDKILTVEGSLKLDCNYTDVSGSVTVNGDLLQSKSRITMNKGSLAIKGDYTVLNNNYTGLLMTHAEDSLHVSGNVNMNARSEYNDWLTDGVFEVEGDFSAQKGIRAFGNHRFIFSGNRKQSISMADGECFAAIELANHSVEGVYSEEPFDNREFVRNGCLMTYGEYTGEYGWTLEEDQVYEGDLVLLEDVLDLNGYTLTVTGDLIQLSGSILVNGGKLIVKGDYRMQSRRQTEETETEYAYGKSAGRLKMLNEEDYVSVDGSFLSTAMVDSTGDLVAGILEIKGDVRVDAAYSDKGFAASENHVLLLNGTDEQVISFGKSGSMASGLAGLELQNDSDKGVVFESDEDHQNAVYVSGTVLDNAQNVTGFIAIGTTTVFSDNAFGGSVIIREATRFEQAVTIGGDLELNGKGDVSLYGNIEVDGNFFQDKMRLYMEQGSLTVLGNYTMERSSSSMLKMSHEEDYIHVYGNVIYNPYTTGASYLTAGTFEIGGDLTSSRGIQASGTHRFLFSGEKRQIINIASNEYFAIVEITNESTEGVYSETTFARQKIITNGCRVTYGDIIGEYGWTLEEDQVYEGDLVLIEGTLDLNGYSLTVTGDLVQLSGVVFVNGGLLTVQGDYHVQFREEKADGTGYAYSASSGYLKMTDNNDKVCILGSYLSDSSVNAEGCLTAGTLEIRGDFIVGSQASEKSFIAGGTHTVLLNGSHKQTVRFGASGYSLARLNNLEITNSSEEGIVFESVEKKSGDKIYHDQAVYISGNVNDHHNTVSGMIGVGAETVFADNYFGAGINIGQNTEVKDETFIKGDMELMKSCTLTISGSLTVEGNVLQMARLDMNKGSMEIYGDYDLQYNYLISSRFSMTSDEDYVYVHGNVDYNPYTCGTKYLSAGTFRVDGNFTSEKGLFAGGTHRFLFAGDKLQVISIADNEYFAIVEIQNNSEEGVYSAYMFNSGKVITNGCRLKYGDLTGEYGWTLSEDQVYEGDLVLIEDTLDLNGYRLTITGDLIQMSGTVFVNGGSLTVQGDYRMQSVQMTASDDSSGEEIHAYGRSTGHLRMTDEADRVCVAGSYISDSASSDEEYLTAGILEIQGDFIVNSAESKKSFIASKAHTVRLGGKGKQTVRFETSGKTSSRLNHLEITNVSEVGVVFESTEKVSQDKTWHENAVYVSGNVNDNYNHVTGVISIDENTVFVNGHFGGSVHMNRTVKVDRELHIDGNVEIQTSANVTVWNSLIVGGDLIQISGGLSMHQGSLEVKGNYYLLNNAFSKLGMYYQEDYVYVRGNVEYNPFNGGTAYLTEGTFEVGGDFTSQTGLQATKNHRFLFSGNKLQTVNIGEKEYFATVEIANYSDQGVFFENAFGRNALIRNGCRIRIGGQEGEFGWTLTEDQEYEGDLILLDDTLDLNGYTLTVTGDLIQVSGTVHINGGTLNVSGDYRLQLRSGNEGSYSYSTGTGVLVMTDAADRVTVEGSFIVQTKGAMQDQLTAGVLEIKGDFVQTGTNAYPGTKEHTLLFSGKSVQVWRQEVAGTVGNIINRNARKLTIQNDVTVYGTLTDETDTVTGNGYLSVTSTDRLSGGKWSGNILLTGKDILKQTLQTGALKIDTKASLDTDGHFITADAIIADGRLKVGSADISCIGDMTVSANGSLIMQDQSGYVLVGGNFEISSQYDHTGSLTAGTLEIRGHFTQRDATNFVATENHTVILARKQTASGRNFIQSVIFNENAGVTRFHKLILRKNLADYRFNNDVYSIADEVVFEIEDETAPVPVAYIKATEVTESTVTVTYAGASDDDGVLGYEIHRDGKLIGVTSQTTYTDTELMPDRAYIYTVYPFDLYRNLTSDSPKCEVITPADTEKPAAPAGLSIGTRTGSSVTLVWDPAVDNVGVSAYSVFRNGTEIAQNVSAVQYQDKGLAANTVYRYQIVAYDISGNSSEWSNAVETTTAMPKITEITPADYSVLGEGIVPITVKFADSGNSKGNRVKIEYQKGTEGTTDGEEADEWSLLAYRTQKTCDASTLYVSYDWKPPVQGVENLRLRITLYDADQNTDVREVAYRIDTQAPELPEKFTAKADNGTVYLTWEPSVSADCASYQLYRKELPPDDESDDEETGWQMLENLEGRYTRTYYTDSNVREGKTYAYALTVKDTYGNTSEFSETVTATADTDKELPKVTDMTPGAGRVSGEAKLVIFAEDNSRVASVRLFCRSEAEEEWAYLAETSASKNESGTFSANYQWDTTELADGIYMIKAIAVDGNGNESSEEYIRRYEADNTGIAKITITKTNVISTAVQIQWADVEEADFAYFQVEQLVGADYVKIGEVSDMLGYNVAGLSPGQSYSFRVVGYDNLDNRGEASDVIEVTTAEDTIAPVICAVYPVEGSYRDALELKMTATDNDMVAKAVFSASLDGETYQEIAVLENNRKSEQTDFSYSYPIASLREGVLYIKFEAFDRAGNRNAPDSDGEDIVLEYTVDCTAPAKVKGLSENGTEGFVGLVWETPSDKDVETYKIYRMDGEHGIFRVIRSDCTTEAYSDTAVRAGIRL